MKLIVCLDNKNGLCFNKRRQSQDRRLRDFIKAMTKDSKLYMNFYTYELYKTLKMQLSVKIFYPGQKQMTIVSWKPAL